MTTRPTIVVVTEEPLFPTNRGSRSRLVTLIRSLRALGFFVVLLTRTTRRLRTLQMRWLADRVVLVTAHRFPGGSPLAYDSSPFHSPLKAAVEQFAPAAVIAEYIWMAPCLDVVPPSVLRVVDTIDLMHVRREFENRLSRVWVTCTPDEERRLLQKADLIIAIQRREQEVFRRLVSDRKVICLPHYVPVAPTPERRRRAVVGIVGSSNPSNEEGLASFLAGAWPVVRRHCPTAELRVFGHLAQIAPNRADVVRVGYTRTLRRAYRDAAVVINPVRTGTGLKIKTVEALAHGKAVVTTRCGAEGLESGSGSAFLVEDDMHAFGDAVGTLLTDHAARARLASAATAFAQTEFSRERVYASFLDAIARHASGDRQPHGARRSGSAALGAGGG